MNSLPTTRTRVPDRKKSSFRRRCVSSGSTVIAEEQHSDPRRNYPDAEENGKIQAVENLQTAAHACQRDLKYILQSARRSEARNLQPCRGFLRAERSSHVQVPGFFAAQFSAGSFGDAAGSN